MHFLPDQKGVLVHELGHNFNLAHSGGLDGREFTDQTGMMGNPLYSDDVGRMCYNAAKSWQIGWYDDRKIQLNPLGQPSDWSETRAMVGIADYLNNPARLPVVIKLETNTSEDYFLGFNRAAGINADNKEADDLVTIVRSGNNGEGYSQSWLLAYIGQGQSYTIAGFGGTDKNIVIEVASIDLNAHPAVATVIFRTDQVPTASPTPNMLCVDQPGTRRVAVDLTTDNYGPETSWTLVNECTGAVQRQSQTNFANNQNYLEEWCAPAARYTFTIHDSYADGMCCG